MTNIVKHLVLFWGTLLDVFQAQIQPNIIFILADDLGWYDVGFRGSEILTPNIDNLAYEGIILNNYYVQPICTPTRSAIMSGRYPIHTGLQHEVIGTETPYGLPLNITIMPQYLKQLGYDTHIVGKWHLGHFEKPYLPTMRGFDSHFGYLTGHEDYYDYVAEGQGTTSWGFDLRHNLDPIRVKTNEYSTLLYTSKTESIIRSHNKSKPLFLYLAHQAVHAGNGKFDPLTAPQRYVDRFPHIDNVPRKLYAGMVSALDDSVGSIVSVLEEQSMINNTIIIFSTDNGAPSNGGDENTGCNWPLRGCKFTVWEGGVRGVGFVYSQLLNKTGYVMENLMHVTDWLPTIYGLAGGDPSKLDNQDGFNMWDMLSLNGSAVRNSVLHNIDPIQKYTGIRIGEYKLVMGDMSRGKCDKWYPPKSGIKNSNYINNETKAPTSTLNVDKHGFKRQPININCGKRPLDADINCQPEQTPCLFHIPTDPCEFTNIADQHPDIVASLLQEVARYIKSMVPPINEPPDPRADPRKHGGFWGPWL